MNIQLERSITFTKISTETITIYEAMRNIEANDGVKNRNAHLRYSFKKYNSSGQLIDVKLGENISVIAWGFNERGNEKKIK